MPASPPEPTPDLTPASVPAIDDWGALLAGQVAVVTGGGAGIGAAVCSLFAQHGARVVIVDIDEPAAVRTRDAITEAGGTAEAVVADVTDPVAARNVVQNVARTYGRLD